MSCSVACPGVPAACFTLLFYDESKPSVVVQGEAEGSDLGGMDTHEVNLSYVFCKLNYLFAFELSLSVPEKLHQCKAAQVTHTHAYAHTCTNLSLLQEML